MFYVAFGRDYFHGNRQMISVPGRVGFFKQVNTLIQALLERETSGDLVFDQHFDIVQNDSWLWESERRDPNCYARNAQKKKAFLSDSVYPNQDW